LRASHPQKTVTSRITVIWTSKRVIDLPPSPNEIGDAIQGVICRSFRATMGGRL
jgi:hypothetical protein